MIEAKVVKGPEGLPSYVEVRMTYLAHNFALERPLCLGAQPLPEDEAEANIRTGRRAASYFSRAVFEAVCDALTP